MKQHLRVVALVLLGATVGLTASPAAAGTPDATTSSQKGLPVHPVSLTVTLPPHPQEVLPLRAASVPTASSFLSRHKALAVIAADAYQVGALALGLGERLLACHAPDYGGAYHPIELVPPPGSTRKVTVFRSNQARSVDDIASFVKLAEAHGVTKLSEIAFINLRAEKDEDLSLLDEFASSPAAAAMGMANGAPIRQVNVRVLDNAPPAIYIGPFGWNRVIAKVAEVYKVLNDPSVKVAVIHCDEGRGRTGEIVAAAVRVAMDNMSPEQAIAEAEQHGLTMPWQKAFIQRFAREWGAGKIQWDN